MNINKIKVTVCNRHYRNNNSVLYNLFLNFFFELLPYFSIINVLYLLGKRLSLKFVGVKCQIPTTIHSWNIWKIKCDKIYFRKCYNGLCYNCLKIQILLTTRTSRRDTFAYMLHLIRSNDDILLHTWSRHLMLNFICSVFNQRICGLNEKKS